jgi:hypothetical protein
MTGTIIAKHRLSIGDGLERRSLMQRRDRTQTEGLFGASSLTVLRRPAFTSLVSLAFF